MTLPDPQSLLLGAVSCGCIRPKDLPSGGGLGVIGRDSAHCPFFLIKVPGTVEPILWWSRKIVNKPPPSLPNPAAPRSSWDAEKGTNFFITLALRCDLHFRLLCQRASNLQPDKKHFYNTRTCSSGVLLCKKILKEDTRKKKSSFLRLFPPWLSEETNGLKL